MLAKQSLFIARTMSETELEYDGRMRIFSILKQVVHREPLGFKCSYEPILQNMQLLLRYIP